MNIEHRTSNIERWRGKGDETDIWSVRKVDRVFGANYRDRWTATKYQSRPPCWGSIVKIWNLTLSKTMVKPRPRSPQRTLSISFVSHYEYQNGWKETEIVFECSVLDVYLFIRCWTFDVRCSSFKTTSYGINVTFKWLQNKLALMGINPAPTFQFLVVTW